MINGGAINSFAINAPAVFSVSEALVDASTISSSLTDSRLISLLEDLTTSSTLATTVVWALVEELTVSGVLSSNATLNSIALSDFSMDDVLIAILSDIVLEDITVSHTEALAVHFLDRLNEILNTTDSPSDQLNALSSIALSITIADILLYVFPESISENFTVSQSSIDLIVGLSNIIDLLEVSLTTNSLILFVNDVVPEEITVDDTNSVQQSLLSTIFDSVQMVTLTDDGDTYSGWVLNPETFAIWNYDNYNFNSMATINGTTFLANNTGLFTMEGSLDDTAFIQSRLKTAALSFGTSNLKQVPDMYLGMSLSGEMVIGVTTDERVNVKYKLVLPSTVQEMQTVKLGKGLRGSLWQFELIDDKATSLDISSIEWVPIIFGRKRR